jgi:hypothetical protein
MYEGKHIFYAKNALFYFGVINTFLQQSLVFHKASIESIGTEKLDFSSFQAG